MMDKNCSQVLLNVNLRTYSEVEWADVEQCLRTHPRLSAEYQAWAYTRPLFGSS
jgi:hypothetical protein